MTLSGAYSGGGAPFQVVPANSTADAFGRLRTSIPTTIFDSKLISDNAPRYWDELLESGAGISAAYDINQSAVTITSTANTAGKFTRSTFQRFNYQSGKSQLIMMTGVLSLSGGGTGVSQRIGQFDDNNGFFFEYSDGVAYVVIRSSTSGSPVERRIPQSEWNENRLDGTLVSNPVVDWSKAQVFVIDYQWLGVGRIRFGLSINGRLTYLHSEANENRFETAYTRTPNLPLRYQLETTASSPESSMKHICVAILSEGGVINLDVTKRISTEGNALDANTPGTLYALMGFRLKSTHLDTISRVVRLTALASTNDDFEWEVRLNPNIAGTFTYNPVTDSAVEIAFGTTANTVTGGDAIDGEWASRQSAISALFSPTRYIGAAIDGTRDESVFCIRPRTSGLNIDGSLTWREST